MTNSGKKLIYAWNEREHCFVLKQANFENLLIYFSLFFVKYHFNDNF